MRYLEDELEDYKEICEKSHISFLNILSQTFPKQQSSLIDSSLSIQKALNSEDELDLKKKIRLRLI
tara:strand:+ start:844 stop:1041 length:198 start_codon:yes stop_codon:yes gene_type:complete